MNPFFKKFSLKISRGFTLLETMIGTGVIAIAVLAFIQLSGSYNEDKQNLRERFDRMAFYKYVSIVLNDQRSCSETLSGLNPATPVQLAGGIKRFLTPTATTLIARTSTTTIPALFSIAVDEMTVGNFVQTSATTPNVGWVDITLTMRHILKAGATYKADPSSRPVKKIFKALVIKGGGGTIQSCLSTSYCELVGGTYNYTTFKCDKITVPGDIKTDLKFCVQGRCREFKDAFCPSGYFVKGIKDDGTPNCDKYPWDIPSCPSLGQYVASYDIETKKVTCKDFVIQNRTCAANEFITAITGPATGNITCAAAPAGPQGPQGIPGITGDVGPRGPTGIQGIAGPKGATGIQGPVGPVGPTGATGARGATGATGPAGNTGATGATGAKGPRGSNRSCNKC